MTNQRDQPSPRPIFFHGREGRGNKGRKATWLREKYSAVTPSYDTSELEAALVTARVVLRENPPSVIIGSSFGGAVLLSLIHEGLWRGPSIFLAQAGGNFGVELTLPEGVPAVLIHGLHDDIVPIEASRELAKSSPSDPTQLFEIDDGHRLGSIMPSGLLKMALETLGVYPLGC
jgi:predicted esterase